MTDHPPLKFAAIGLDHRHIYHQVGRLLELGAVCKGWHGRDDAVPLEGFVKRFPELHRVADPRVLLEDPEVQLIVSAGIPGERAEIAIEAMRHGKDVMVDKPGVITADQLDAVRQAQRRDRQDLVGQLLRALRGAGDDPGAGAGRGRRARPGGADRGLRPAPPQPPPAPALVLRSGPRRRHPRRHRLAPDRPVPGVHRRERRRDRRERGRQPRQPRDPRVRGLRRDPAAQRPRPAATSGSTGTPPTACRPGATAAARSSAPRATSSCGNTSTSPAAPAPTTCSWSTAKAPATSTAARRPLPYYERLIADVFERTETAMPQAHCFKVCELAVRAQAKATRLG